MDECTGSLTLCVNNITLVIFLSDKKSDAPLVCIHVGTPYTSYLALF